MALVLCLGVSGTFTGWMRAIEINGTLRELVAKQKVLLNEYRQELTEKALMYAMDGDIVTTSKIADRLEKLEDSKAQVLLIHGLSDFYGGEMPRAQSRLQQAVAMEPDNLSAMGHYRIVEEDEKAARATELLSEAEGSDLPNALRDFALGEYRAKAPVLTNPT